MAASRAPAAPAHFAADIRSVTFQQLIDEGVLEIGDGYRAKNEELSLSGPGPIFLRAGHVTPTSIDFSGVERFVAAGGAQLSAKMSQPGDLVLTTKGASTGRTAFVTPELPRFVYSPHLSFWRSKAPEVIASGFLRYWASSVPFLVQLRAMQASTDMAAYMSLTDQRRLQIDLPSIEVQRTIAHILGTLDDKIDLNRRTNETLEAMARALFKSWFEEFDPVHAKKAGRKPEGMDAETAALFPDDFEDSELGLIPLGWEVTPLGRVISVLDALRIPLSSEERRLRQGPYPYHGATSVMDYVDAFLFDGVHVLVGEDGSVVHQDGTPFVQYVWGRFWVNNHAHVLRGARGVSEEHLKLLLEHTNIAGHVTGAVQAKLNQANMRCIPILYPGQDVCGAFATRVKGLYAKLRSATEQTRTLSALRDALLPQLLSGSLRVPEAMRLVEKAM